MNRPSPDEVEADDRCGVMVLTGEGTAFSAGMVKEYFRDMKDRPRIVNIKVRRLNWERQWRRLRYFQKPTIPMVNGRRIGGAFLPMVSCDIAIAAEDAQFGLSEVNFGIFPASNVPRAMAEMMPSRQALYYIMTGELFDDRKAAELGLVNEAVPREKLRDHVRAVADVLLEKSPDVLKGAKVAYKRVKDLDWDTSEDHLISKQAQL